MPRHERAAKSAAIALAAQLDSEMSFEERERMERSGMGVGGGLNKGEDQLFGACPAMASGSWERGAADMSGRPADSAASRPLTCARRPRPAPLRPPKTRSSLM